MATMDACPACGAWSASGVTAYRPLRQANSLTQWSRGLTGLMSFGDTPSDLVERIAQTKRCGTVSAIRHETLQKAIEVRLHDRSPSFCDQPEQRGLSMGSATGMLRS